MPQRKIVRNTSRICKSPSPKTIGGRTTVIGTRAANSAAIDLGGPLGTAIIRNRLGWIALDARPLGARRPRRRQRRHRNQHRRRLAPGTRIGHVAKSAGVHLHELTWAKRRRQSRQVIDHVDPVDGRAHRRRVAHVPFDPSRAQSIEGIAFRSGPHQAGDFVPLVDQPRGQIGADETARPRDQHPRHVAAPLFVMARRGRLGRPRPVRRLF